MNETTLCPYDSNHVIVRRHRVGSHVAKCRETWLKNMKERQVVIEYEQCKYIPWHKIPWPEIDYHYGFCNEAFPLPPPPPRPEPVPKTDEELRKERDDIICPWAPVEEDPVAVAAALQAKKDKEDAEWMEGYEEWTPPPELEECVVPLPPPKKFYK